MKNELLTKMTEKVMTIKSTELVEIINKFREVEGGKAELRHDSFMTKIRKEIKTLESLGLTSHQNFLEAKYLDKQGKERECYELNRDGMLQMLNSESTLVRYKTIEYINQLEIDNKQLENDKEELHKIALSSKEQKKRKYEADKVLYGWKSIRSLLENCTYKNIEDTVENIIDFHVNVLKKNDRAYSYKDMNKTEYKQAIRDRVFNILEDIYNTTLDGTLRSVVGELRVNNRQNVIETKNRSNGHKISELENKINKLNPSLEEMYCINYHPFTWNCALDNGHRTFSYNKWINNFPITEVPDREIWENDYGVDFNKPIKIFLRYINLAKFDMDNLSKSLIDRLFNEYRGVYEIDDNIIHAKDEKTIGHCDKYEDGKIYFFIQNMNENEIENIEYEVI